MPYTADHYAQLFLTHRKALEGLIDKIPEDQANFQSWDGSMTFKTLADHLTASCLRFSAMAAGSAPDAFEPSDSFNTAKTKLKASTETTTSALKSLSNDQLNALIDAFGGKMPVYALIDIMREHEAHHKGQLWMMARMIGVEPGRFLKRD